MTKDTGKVLIHGKEYETVASRVQKFRDKYGNDMSLQTKIISIDENSVVMQAAISSKDGIIATGHAEEKRSASTINRTSALENCETSAIGRALAAFGLAGTEFASADEVAQAISQQGTGTKSTELTGMATDKQRETIARHLKSIGVAEEDQKGYLIEQFGVKLPLTKQVASEVIDSIFAG